MNELLKKLADDLKESGEHDEAKEVEHMMPKSEKHHMVIEFAGDSQEEVVRAIYEALAGLADKMDEKGKEKEASAIDGVLQKLAVERPLPPFTDEQRKEQENEEKRYLKEMDYDMREVEPKREANVVKAFEIAADAAKKAIHIAHDSNIQLSYTSKIEKVIKDLWDIKAYCDEQVKFSRSPAASGAWADDSIEDKEASVKNSGMNELEKEHFKSSLMFGLDQMHEKGNQIIRIVHNYGGDRGKLGKAKEHLDIAYGLVSSAGWALLKEDSPEKLASVKTANINEVKAMNLDKLYEVVQFVGEMDRDGPESIVPIEMKDHFHKAHQVLSETYHIAAEKLLSERQSPERLASLADKLDAMGLTKEADLIDETIQKLAKDVEWQKEDSKTEQSKRYNAKYNNEQTFQQPKIEKPKKIEHHIPEYRNSENKALSTRYCKDHPGVMLNRVGEGIYECELDHKRYNYELEYGSVAAQTPSTSNISLPSRLFDPNEERLNRVN